MSALQEFTAAITGFAFPVDRCLYCGSTGAYEMDHFPIPAELGGTETVRACIHCHNMKDRVSHAVAQSWLMSQAKELDHVVVTVPEALFIVGRGSLMPRPAMHLIDDIREFPPAARVMIARRLIDQIRDMQAAG